MYNEYMAGYHAVRRVKEARNLLTEIGGAFADFIIQPTPIFGDNAAATRMPPPPRSATTASLRLLVPGGDPANEGTNVTLKRPPRNSRHGGGAAAQSLLDVRVGQNGCCVVLLPAASSKL
jgi:hypothetical protein